MPFDTFSAGLPSPATLKVMKSRFVSLAGAFALLATSSVVAQDEGKITEGRLDAIGADGRPLGPCPLKHTSVEAEISGTLARVSVTQQFHNPFKDKIEAIYVFPLHQESAVDDMTMTVGDRVVKGVIKEREEAKRIYEQAKAQGKVAALLEQERPNIFTQSVANIEPGGQAVSITIRYTQTMAGRTGGTSSSSRWWSVRATSRADRRRNPTGCPRWRRAGCRCRRSSAARIPAAGPKASRRWSIPTRWPRPARCPMPTASPRRWWRRDTAPDTTSRSRSGSMPGRHGFGP